MEPEDDLRITNLPTDPALLDALAKSFTDSKFDLKKLVRTICVSSTYRLSSLPNEWNASDRQNFRRVPAASVAGGGAVGRHRRSDADEAGVQGRSPAGIRRDPASGQPGRVVLPQRLSADPTTPCKRVRECERSADSSLAQALHLYNSVELGKKTAGDRLRRLVADKRPVEDRLSDLYLIALSRRPTVEELAGMKEYLENRTANVSAAYEDILWALVNTKEFMSIH